MRSEDDNDHLEKFQWDGSEDSDEEIEELTKLKNKDEIKSGIKFSRRGLIDFIET